MTPYKNLAPSICVEDPVASRDFYVKHFEAKVTFDCGWYIGLQIGKCELCFMSPQSPEQSLFNGKGLSYNFEVEDVDAECSRLTGLGLTPIIPLEDHPWGDRGFAVLDPNGVVLYIYTPIEPSEEFRQYHK